MTTFIDTGVVIAVLNPADPHHSWSARKLQYYKAQGPAIISDIVYSEFCAGMPSQAAVDAVITRFGLERLRHSKSALFLAGQAFVAYRNRGGPKTSLLSDILIGALAADAGKPLMTSNSRDFAKHFPKLELITP